MGLGPFSDPLWRKTRYSLMDGGPLIISRQADLEEWLTSAAGVIINMRGSLCQVQIQSGAAGRTRWKKCEPPRYLYKHDAWGTEEQTFRLPWDVEANWCITTRLNTSAPGVNLDGMIMAMGLGSNNNNPTYPIGQFPNHPIVMLYCRVDTMTWELLTAFGDVSAFTVTPLVGVEPMVLGKGSHPRLIWQPTGGPAGGPQVIAMVDGVVGCIVNDPTKIPPTTDQGGTVEAHMSYFELASNGTAVNGALTCHYGPTAIDNRGWLTAP